VIHKGAGDFCDMVIFTLQYVKKISGCKQVNVLQLFSSIYKKIYCVHAVSYLKWLMKLNVCKVLN